MHIQSWSSAGLIFLKHQPDSLFSLTPYVISIYNLKESVFRRNLMAETVLIHIFILSTPFIEYLLCSKFVLELERVAAYGEVSRAGNVRRLF